MARLAEEFERRLKERDEQIAQLTEFRTLVIFRLAAQHDEVEHPRRQVTKNGVVRRLPEATNHTAPFGSCSEGRSRFRTRARRCRFRSNPSEPPFAPSAGGANGTRLS